MLNAFVDRAAALLGHARTSIQGERTAPRSRPPAGTKPSQARESSKNANWRAEDEELQAQLLAQASPISATVPAGVPPRTTGTSTGGRQPGKTGSQKAAATPGSAGLTFNELLAKVLEEGANRKSPDGHSATQAGTRQTPGLRPRRTPGRVRPAVTAPVLDPAPPRGSRKTGPKVDDNVASSIGRGTNVVAPNLSGVPGERRPRVTPLHPDNSQDLWSTPWRQQGPTDISSDGLGATTFELANPYSFQNKWAVSWRQQGPTNISSLYRRRTRPATLHRSAPTAVPIQQPVPVVPASPPTPRRDAQSVAGLAAARLSPSLNESSPGLRRPVAPGSAPARKSNPDPVVVPPPIPVSLLAVSARSGATGKTRAPISTDRPRHRTAHALAQQPQGTPSPATGQAQSATPTPTSLAVTARTTSATNPARRRGSGRPAPAQQSSITPAGPSRWTREGDRWDDSSESRPKATGDVFTAANPFELGNISAALGDSVEAPPPRPLPDTAPSGTDKGGKGGGAAQLSPTSILKKRAADESAAPGAQPEAKKVRWASK
ncbi:hypothetical protein VPNG_02284 [Cytospora leucostoma]|uniref:Uncharacterized protein n=1 Tax=Cytospora leucostoma TaxID=1230097 RepID=A0A423XGJ4_9PEZI|nr:hypothetical protein VPNG_02284 [Cytospora leucostoma]